ncbi:MAG: class I SAM-dependent methyltransferase [Deltaproteobacteria bacterium]|nr:class I SAM-dependent methyltransferase [Deltaproteobacteria bacterium]
MIGYGSATENVPMDDNRRKTYHNPIADGEEKYYWSSVAKEWKEQGPQKLWRIHADALNSDLIARWLPSSTVVDLLLKTDLFDEAFGNGLRRIMEAKSCCIVGMDISEPIVCSACESGEAITGISADLRSLPFQEETFDIVLSISSLDHFKTRHEIIVALRELHRVLKKGGRIIITLDNPGNPLIALRGLLPFKFLNRMGIVPYYLGATAGHAWLRRVMEDAGFTILECSAIMHFPRVLAVAMARVLEIHAGPDTQEIFRRTLKAFERLSLLPTRFLTGHFTAIKAVKQ